MKAENASQQDVFSRKIGEMGRANDETLLKYTARIGILHEVLRLQSRSENRSEACSSQNKSPTNSKREVSVASTARSMSPGTTYVIHAILSAIERMDQRTSALSERVDRSDRPSEEPARGRSTTRRMLRETPLGGPMAGVTIQTIANIVRTVISSKGSLQEKVMIQLVGGTEIK